VVTIIREACLLSCPELCDGVVMFVHRLVSEGEGVASCVPPPPTNHPLGNIVQYSYSLRYWSFQTTLCHVL
jgi:hypothetical protein